MKTETRSELLENEWFQVRHSGETPEIAYHSSIYYLTADTNGPGLKLESSERATLLAAARERYCEIIFRDITPDNRGTTIYRGILRSICNWKRFKRFCARHDMEWNPLREDVAKQLITFLSVEIADIESGRGLNSINCTSEELVSFSLELGVVLEDIHDEVGQYCLPSRS